MIVIAGAVFPGGQRFAGEHEQETRFSELADAKDSCAYPEAYQKNFNDGRAPAKSPRSAITRRCCLRHGPARRRRQEAPRGPKRIYRRVSAMADDVAFPWRETLDQARRDRSGGCQPSWPVVPDFKPRPLSVLMLLARTTASFRTAAVTTSARGRPRAASSGRASRTLWTERNGGDRTREPLVEGLPDRDPKDGCRLKKLRTPPAERWRSRALSPRRCGTHLAGRLSIPVERTRRRGCAAISMQPKSSGSFSSTSEAMTPATAAQRGVRCQAGD